MPLLLRVPRLVADGFAPSQQEMPLGGRKFDVRLFVLVTNVMPLELFLCREALCRFAATPYESPTAENVGDNTMHLTNYAISKNVASVKAVVARALLRSLPGSGDQGSGEGSPEAAATPSPPALSSPTATAEGGAAA